MDRRELVKKVGAVGALAAVPGSAAIPQPVAPAVDAETIKESVIRTIADAVNIAHNVSGQPPVVNLSPVRESAPQSPGQTVFDGRVMVVLHERWSGTPFRVNPALVTHYWGEGPRAVLRLVGRDLDIKLTESVEEVDAILRW